jgi:transcriptional regulator with XRE-family HTH domain
MTGTPPVRRRLLGAALRGYRESMGYNLDQAARILECDRSKVSRIETGQRGIRPKELRELLTEYGVAAGEQEALLAIAHSGRLAGWWLDYADVLSEAGQDYVFMEIAATEILSYEPNQVPDLLQTPRYASAVAAADANCASAEQRSHAVEVKLTRQRIALGASVTQAGVAQAGVAQAGVAQAGVAQAGVAQAGVAQAGAPASSTPAARRAGPRIAEPRARRLDFVITEGALRQAVGGPAVMRDQLSRLAALAEAGDAQAGDAQAGDAEAGDAEAGDAQAGDAQAGDSAGNRAGNRAGAGARVSLRVLPFAAGAHAAAGCGSMTILRFAQTPGIGVIHLAGLSGGVSLEGREEVARYLRTFSQLKTAALPPRESARLLRAMARG